MSDPSESRIDSECQTIALAPAPGGTLQSVAAAARLTAPTGLVDTAFAGLAVTFACGGFHDGSWLRSMGFEVNGVGELPRAIGDEGTVQRSAPPSALSRCAIR